MWNDTSCRQLIAAKYEWFLDQWDEYPYDIQHADVCRYFVLHQYGGVYADMDMRPLRNIGPWLEKSSKEEKQVLLLEKDTQLGSHDTLCIGMMASIQGTSFWEAVFTVLQERRHRWFYALSPHVRVIMSSGPQAVMAVVRKQRRKVGVFPAEKFYACGPCSTLPCQREGGWIRFESGGFSWNKIDSMVVNAIDCGLGRPFLNLVMANHITMSLAFCLLLAVGIWAVCHRAKDWAMKITKYGKKLKQASAYVSKNKKALRSKLCVVLVVILILEFMEVPKLVNKNCHRLCKLTGNEDVLLVTAHPDDESMFFVPTIDTCHLRGNRVHLLCLSTGNAAGLGKEREQELEAAAKVLNVHKVTVVNDTRLQDGMQNEWDTMVIREHVEKYLKAHKIGSVVTFDEMGVSQHPNHLAIHRAMKEMHRSVRRLGIKFFQLETVNFLRKFSGVVDVLPSIRDSLTCEFFTGSLSRSWDAMQVQTTQWVWFRKLFVVFSRYTYANTLRDFDDLLFSSSTPCSVKQGSISPSSALSEKDQAEQLDLQAQATAGLLIKDQPASQ